MKLFDLLAKSDPSAPYAGELWTHAQPVGHEFGARSAILVVDLEATCSHADPDFDMETIEIWRVLDRRRWLIARSFSVVRVPGCESAAHCVLHEPDRHQAG
jgi:hypothetical protein